MPALAWRQTLRDFSAGELRLLAVAMMLAVATLTAVGFFADRLGSGPERNAGQLLGAGALVGGLASTAAMVVGWMLARYAFEFAWALVPASSDRSRRCPASIPAAAP